MSISPNDDPLIAGREAHHIPPLEVVHNMGELPVRAAGSQSQVSAEEFNNRLTALERPLLTAFDTMYAELTSTDLFKGSLPIQRRRQIAEGTIPLIRYQAASLLQASNGELRDIIPEEVIRLGTGSYYRSLRASENVARERRKRYAPLALRNGTKFPEVRLSGRLGFALKKRSRIPSNELQARGVGDLLVIYGISLAMLQRQAENQY